MSRIVNYEGPTDAEQADPMRHATMLRLHHDMTYRQIATVMQVSIDTVKAHLHRARRRLAELKDY